ncbi:unnamed protein product [Caenorhabditis angaria]|uniref:BHLH domain-containing protein n=1 Tax=Caenorhabditis angaria TaxID=860376 RepID=A0A9P1IB75_9PELO|nr:unnamed protein product [Caenorhabditis angaria]
MVLLMNKEETPFLSRMSHKSIREKERRDEINNKINELRGFVCEDEIERKTLKQADVLIRTVELVHRMESEQPGPSFIPERKGFVDGFNSVESQVSNFIKQLGLDFQTEQEYLAKLKACFEHERSSLMINNISPKSNGCGPFRSKWSPESTRSTPSPYTLKMDRKEIKKNREQDRRDRQGEAIEALKQFLISISGGKLRSQVEKMQRLNTLENIIEYIRNKKSMSFGVKSTRDQTLYSHAWTGGFEIAKRTALEFFRRDRHLCVRTAALEQHIMSNYRIPTVVPIQLPTFIPFYNTAPIFHQQFQPTSPAYSLESPPPMSDTSMESATTCSTQTIWRPWE